MSVIVVITVLCSFDIILSCLINYYNFITLSVLSDNNTYIARPSDGDGCSWGWKRMCYYLTGLGHTWMWESMESSILKRLHFQTGF